MRRTLFGRASDLPTVTGTSAKEALLFDVRDQSESADLTLAERRVGSWTFAPWLVLSGHLIMAVSLLLQQRPAASWAALANVCIPFGVSILLDAAAGLVMLLWRRMQLAPHTVVRLMCGYLAGTGGAWAIASVAAGSLRLADPSFVTLAMSAGFFIRSLVAAPAPPLAVVNAVVAIATTSLLSRNLQMTFAIDSLAMLLVVYSMVVEDVIRRPKAARNRVAGKKGAQFRRRVRKQRAGLVLGNGFTGHLVLRLQAALGGLPV